MTKIERLKAALEEERRKNRLLTEKWSEAMSNYALLLTQMAKETDEKTFDMPNVSGVRER